MEFGRLLAQAEKRLAEARKATTSESGQPSMRPPELNVEQYAWVCATLGRASTDELPEVLTRLRLSEATRASLDAQWDVRIAENPELERVLTASLAKLGAPPRTKPKGDLSSTRPMAPTTSGGAGRDSSRPKRAGPTLPFTLEDPHKPK